MIRLTVLGSTDLRRPDGQSILSVLAQPKRLTLLAYLALNATGGFVRRDKLLALFWPESETDKARASLRRSLSYLRTSLGDGVIATRGDEETGIEAVAMECDALRFEEAIAQGDAEAAWRLYGGSLLDGLFASDASDLQRWIEYERNRLERQAVEAAASLADRSDRKGDLREAVDWARKALSLAPQSEPEIRRLIALLERLGDREGAVRTYDEFATRLAAELDLEPSAETQALVESSRSAPAPAKPPVITRDGPAGGDLVGACAAGTLRNPESPPPSGAPLADQVTVTVLEAFLDAFNRHDLDSIMGFFADDCVFCMPRGAGPRGDRYGGKNDVRAGLATRFEGIPDVHYGDDRHRVCGDSGVSEWTLTALHDRANTSKCAGWTCSSSTRARSRARIHSGKSLRDPVRSG
jgi:DNA-binding SARP family transcriptional activator